MPPAAPISPITDRMMSLALTSGGSLPSMTARMFFDLRWISVCVASTCSTSDVPIPIGERAEGAVGRGVAVAADNHGARQRETLLRSDHVADALPPVQLIIIFKAEQFRILGEIGDLRRAFWIRIGFAAVRRRHVVVDHQKRLFGCLDRKAGAPQAAERLRAVDLVHEVPVDIE